MHRVEKLERMLAEAMQRGYIVRQEWLDGRGGGACEIAGQQYLFVDLALSTAEQLGQISEALSEKSMLSIPSSDYPSERPRAA
jgi:hypothetical protein